MSPNDFVHVLGCKGSAVTEATHHVPRTTFKLNTSALLTCLGASLLRSICLPSLKFQQNVNAKAHACFLFQSDILTPGCYHYATVVNRIARGREIVSTYSQVMSYMELHGVKR